MRLQLPEQEEVLFWWILYAIFQFKKAKIVTKSTSILL